MTTNSSDFDIAPISIVDEMEKSYLDYAMSVIVSRALPDVRDGLKPVQRRILYAMKEGGYDQGKPLRKSARIVGDVMSKYHPHGDKAIYDAMVRMAQPFSLRLVLIQGQGNFGSLDGDPPAAMRYTEARLAHAAAPLLDDIGAQTVPFVDNYDTSDHEPEVLPAAFPNLLVNGAGGIAVGMATNIPPHNLGEVLQACHHLIDNPDCDEEVLWSFIPGPDFPTGGIILGSSAIRQAYKTGRGVIKVRSRVAIEDGKDGRQSLVITEIPYQVNKARLLEKIAEVARDNIVEGIADLRDLSDRHGVRVVVTIKRDAQADVVLNRLYRHTPLQNSFGINMLALAEKKPQTLSLRQALEYFLAFRENVIRRRLTFYLNRAREKAHILIGLALALAHIDPLVTLIRQAKGRDEAKERLRAQSWSAQDIAPLLERAGEAINVADGYQLSEVQANAILDLRLHRLTGLERNKIRTDLEETMSKVEEYIELLAKRPKLLALMHSELNEIAKRFTDPRRTQIAQGDFEIEDEALIPTQDIVVTLSRAGYIKRLPRSTYRAQRRGGKGRTGMTTKEQDWLTHVYDTNTHMPLLFFSSRGISYKLKAYMLPVGGPQARGKPLVNILPLRQGESISALMPFPQDQAETDYVVFATASGYVRRNRLADFAHVKANGKIAIKLPEGDSLVTVLPCHDDQDVFLATRQGKCIRFPLANLRVFSSRSSRGVRGINLASGDRVVAMTIVPHVDATPEERESWLRNGKKSKLLNEDKKQMLADKEGTILTLTSSGMGKKTSTHAYRVTHRGGKGIVNIVVPQKSSAHIVTALPVDARSQLLAVTDHGKIIRCPVSGIRTQGRSTQGVRVFNIDKESLLTSAAVLSLDEDNNDGQDSTPQANSTTQQTLV